MLKPLEKRLLMEFCRKHNIDPQEIDDSLTYWENKKHLEQLAINKEADNKLIESEMERYEKYFLENPLKFYVYIYKAEKDLNTEMQNNNLR